jgi:hypothetical protein
VENNFIAKDKGPVQDGRYGIDNGEAEYEARGMDMVAIMMMVVRLVMIVIVVMVMMIMMFVMKR